MTSPVRFTEPVRQETVNHTALFNHEEGFFLDQSDYNLEMSHFLLTTNICMYVHRRSHFVVISAIHITHKDLWIYLPQIFSVHIHTYVV